MKKILSLTLILILCLSMTGTLVNASPTYLYDYDSYSDFGTLVRASKSEAFGIGGKTATDSSAKITIAESSDKTGYFDLAWGKVSGSSGSYTWDKASYKGYLINEFSIWADSSVTYAYVCTNQNADIGGNTISSLISNRWNRIVTVTDRSGGTNNGKTATYVNGALARSWTADKFGSLQTSGQPRNTIRYLLGGTPDTRIYLDDLKVYETDTVYTPSPLIIKGDGFAGASGYLTVTKSITPADIIAAGYNARVYTDESLAVTIGNNDAIVKGNIVVVQEDDNSIWYYELDEWDGITEIADDPSKITLNKATQEAIGGIYGKPAADTCYALTDSDEKAVDIFYNLSWSPKNSLSNYLVFETNVAAKGNKGYITLGTNSNASMSAKAYIGSDMASNRWYKFTVVYNIAEKKSDTYLNGSPLAKNLSGSYTVGTSNCIRFLMINTEDTVYIDDLRIYEAVGYPDITAPVTVKNGLDALSGIITEADTLSFLSGSGLDGAKELFYPDSVRIYNDNAYSDEKSITDAAEKGNIAVTETAGKTYSYYTISTYDKGEIMVLGDESYNKTYNTLYNGTIDIIAAVDEGIYASALYSSDGKLIKLNIDSDEGGYINTSFAPEYGSDGYIKLFVWDSKTNLRPIGTKKKIEYTDGQVVCFLGDSITQNGKYIRELYEHYLANTDAIPGVEIYNCGIPGDKTAQGLARIDRDCLNYNPDVVFVCFGVNNLDRKYYDADTYTSYTAQQAQIMETYTNETRQIIEKIMATGARAVICTPPPHNDEASGLVRNIGLAKMTEILYELAEEYNLDVVDYFNAMKDLDYATYIMTDNVHPNDRGHHVMAQTVLKTFGYVDEIDTGDAISVYSGTNEKRHTESYNYRLVLLKDTMEFQNLATVEERYAAAYEKMLQQTDSHQKFIYQTYCNNCHRIDEMKQDVINLTRLTACK